MSGTVSTQAQLLAQFADGQPAGSIIPVYVRNIIATMFNMELCPVTTQINSYSFALTDAETCVEYNSTTAGFFSILPFSSVAFPVGTVIYACQVNTGQLTISPGNGVTISTPSTNPITTRAQWSTLMLRCRAQNWWVVSGDMT